MCGTAEWEWDADRFAYEPVEKYCHGCFIKDAAQDTDPRRNMAGITVELLPTRTIEGAKRFVKAMKRYQEKDRDAASK